MTVTHLLNDASPRILSQHTHHIAEGMELIVLVPAASADGPQALGPLEEAVHAVHVQVPHGLLQLHLRPRKQFVILEYQTANDTKNILNDMIIKGNAIQYKSIQYRAGTV